MVKIKQVRFIKNNAKGEAINLVVLDLSNGKPSIVRTAKAFIQDLDNSFLVENVSSIRDPRVRTWMRDLKGATITGDIKHHKAGETWIVQETSSVMTDKNHPQFGTVEVGQSMTYEKDMTRVDGFLDFQPNEMVMARQANAHAMAQMQAQLAGAFDTFDTPSNDVIEGATPEEEFDPNMIPHNVSGAATGDDTPE